MPMRYKTFLLHRIEFAEMLSAVKEIELMNRTDMTAMMNRLNFIEDHVLKLNKDKLHEEDVMVG